MRKILPPFSHPFFELRPDRTHSVARGELSTALDLLNVLSPATEPPNVDPNTIPLAHETLALVPTAVPPPAPLADPTSDTSLASLVLAESLASIKHNARLFFAASEDLIPLGQDEGTNHESEGGGEGERSKNRTSSAAPPTAKSPDPWPTILSLHANSPARSLVPLGAVAGASLTGRNEARSARQVGVFYGFEEAAREFRRASVATVAELVSRDVERRGGRQLEVEMSSPSSDLVESEIWGRQRRRPRQRPRGEDIDREDEDGEGDDEDEGSVEAILTKRNRSAFAEELFAKVSSLSGSEKEKLPNSLSLSAATCLLFCSSFPKRNGTRHSGLDTRSQLRRGENRLNSIE